MDEGFYGPGCTNEGRNEGFRVPVWRGNIWVFFIEKVEEGCALMMTFELEAIDDGQRDGSGGRGDEVVGHPPSLRLGNLKIDGTWNFKKLLLQP